MSYSPLRLQDSLNELISSSNDSIIIFNKVLESSSNDEITLDFINWFQKLICISKPNAIKLMRKNYKYFNSKERELINLKLNLNKKSSIEDYKDE